MCNWLIRIQNGVAYIYKRKYWLGFIAMPFGFSGGTRLVRTPDANAEVLDASIKYVLSRDSEAEIKISFKPWRK